jgi:hypothetical protein
MLKNNEFFDYSIQQWLENEDIPVVLCYHRRHLINYAIKKSRYTPWRRLGEEKLQLLLIHDLGTRSKWSESRPGRALPPGKGLTVPIVQEAGWVSEPVWTQRIEEKSLPPAEDRTPIAQSSSP